MQFDIQELIKNIQAGMHCPNCHSAYPKENISILGCVENVCLVHLECNFCLKPVLATVMVEGQKIKNTTLQRKTSRQASLQGQTKGEKVNTDDVIAIHQFLKNFDGNFSEILDEKE